MAGKRSGSGITNTRSAVNGRDISGTWERRSDKYDFEIDDVINAQGFDGLPRVVSAEEFDKAVAESGFIAQRTYSAPDQETLEAYQDALYNGKWYVDCSTGGAAYGQGMYVAGNYNGELTDAIKQEMLDYQKLNKNYSGKDSVHNVETMTLAPNAKIIDYHTIYKEFDDWQSTADKRAKQKYIDSLGITEDAKTVLRAQTNSLKINESFSDALSRYTKFSQNEINKLNDYVKDINMVGRKAATESTNYDVGFYAALKGYDAIRTTHGTSGADTVILNRSKVIFKKED